jgi:hypothetical protein
MPKSRLNDFSTTADDNTDIGGIGIQGSNLPSNLDNAIRELMKQIAAWREGTALEDSATFNDPTDSTKVFRFDGENIPTGTTREIDAEALYDLSQEATDLIALLTPQFQNYLSGLTLSNGSDATNDIDIAAGTCMNSTNTALLVLASTLTKRLDAAWAVGTGNGGLDTGSIADTTYHIHLIKRLDTGVVDALFSTSATSPTLPTNYTVFRRIGSVVRASGSILAFSQNGDEFLLNVPVLDIDTTQSTSETLRTLSVPAGIKVRAKMRVRGSQPSTGWGLLFSSPDVADTAPSGSANPLIDIGAGGGATDRATLEVRTNTSRQIRTRASAGSTEIQIATYGWVDTRGK